MPSNATRRRKNLTRQEAGPLGAGSRVFCYCRASGHPNQEASIPEQRAELLDYATQRGYVIAGWYEDSGSGTSTDARPQFLRMIEACHASPPPVQAVLLWRRDRFARNEDDDPYFAADLRRHGVEPISVVNPSPDGPYKRLLEAVDAHGSAQFIERLRQDTMRGQRRHVDAGYALG